MTRKTLSEGQPWPGRALVKTLPTRTPQNQIPIVHKMNFLKHLFKRSPIPNINILCKSCSKTWELINCIKKLCMKSIPKRTASMKPKAWSRWKNGSANSAYGEKEKGKGGDNSRYREKHNRKRSANPRVRDKQIWKIAKRISYTTSINDEKFLNKSLLLCLVIFLKP